MVSSSKKLPCGHIFHSACLRSWFQRQQTCPTCRLNILRTPITSSQQQPQNQAANNNNNINNNNQNPNLNNARPNGIVNNQGAALAAGNNPFLHMLAQTAATGTGTGNTTIPGSSTSQTTSNTTIPTIPPFLFPTIPPFVAPYSVPPPPPPPNLDRLTDEELRALEGHERKNVEERIKVKFRCALLAAEYMSRHVHSIS